MMCNDGELLVIFGGSIILKECNDTFFITLKDLLDENNLITLNV